MDELEFNFIYNNHDLTQMVNADRVELGFMNAINFAPIETLKSRKVRISQKDGVIAVLGVTSENETNVQSEDEEISRYFEIPNFTDTLSITTENEDDQLEIVGNKVTESSIDSSLTDKIEKTRLSHAITLEYLRSGVLKGLIKDGYGNVLLDIYSAFGITQPQINFGLNSTTTDLGSKTRELKTYLMSNLRHEVSTGVEVIAGSEWFDKFNANKGYREDHLYGRPNVLLDETTDNTGNVYGSVIRYKSITIRECTGTVALQDGTSETYIGENQAFAYPAGMRNTIRTFVAPPKAMSQINKKPSGDNIYMTRKMLDHEKGVEIKAQTNRLALCKRPKLIVELTTG